MLGGATGSLLLKVAHAILTVAITVVLARALGPEGYGRYAFVYALVILCAIPAQAGLPTLLVREVAAYEARGGWRLMRGLLRRANQAVAAATAAIALVSALVGIFLGDRVAEGELAIYAWGLALLPLLALGNLRGAALRGLRKVVRGQLPELLLRPGLFVLALTVVAVAGAGVSPGMAMALHAGAALVAFLIGAWLLLRVLPHEARSATPEYRTRAWAASVLPLTLLAGIQVVNNQTDVVLLGVLASKEEVGIYRVVFQAATLVVFVLTAVNMVLAPHFARLHAMGERAELERLARWGAKMVLLAAAPVAAGLVIFGGPVLGFVFGTRYAVGAAALAILCVGQLANAAMGSVGLLLNMTGHERDTAVGVGLAAGANVVLNLLLIPPFGIEGAATATAASLMIWNVVLYRRVRRRLDVVPTAWAPRSRRRPS